MKNISQEKIAEMSFVLLAQVCKEKGVLPETKDEILKKSVDFLVKAFDSIESYQMYKKKKRSGGYRTISAPSSELKRVQRKLLSIFYRLQKRRDYYFKNPSDYEKVLYCDGLKQFIDYRLHGSLKNKSVTTAGFAHTINNANFLIELDLKDAFPSVTKEIVFDVIEKIIVNEFKSYFYTYKGQKNRLKGYSSEYRKRKKIGKHFNDSYIRFPLFSSRDCYDFRLFVRDQARDKEFFEDTQLGEIATMVARLITDLVTHKGFLPQGAPTSGLVLNFVLSEKIMPLLAFDFRNKISVYVDNVLITTDKKPTQEMIETIISAFEKCSLFKINSKKTAVYDLRNQSGYMLGMKLVKRTANFRELEYMRAYKYSHAPLGFKKRDQAGKTWSVLHLSIPKELQKLYRSILHRCVVQNVEEDILAKAHGYVGHLVSVYGWPASCMPSCLSKTVHLFREKYKIYKK